MVAVASEICQHLSAKGVATLGVTAIAASMRRTTILWIFLLALPSLSAVPRDRAISFIGEASENQTFRKSIGHGLDFVLVPSSMGGDIIGWTISVSPQDKPAGRECDDFVAEHAQHPLP